LQLAHDNNVNYLFEASVGGGIPIIRPLNKCLAANRIMSITGIVNGTTNYILTKMKNEGLSFDDALKEARRKGYVESNPKEDIDGYDAARKLSILSTIAFDEFIDYRKIRPEGISRLGMIDMEYADSINSVIKLLAIGKRVSRGIFCKVAPVILQKSHPLASVEDIFNAIVVEGNIVGDAMFYGRGAGKLPTASAIIADIMDVVNNVYSNGKRLWKVKEHSELIDSEMYDASLFVRVGIIDMPSAKKLISEKMGEVKFVDIGKKYEIGFITQQERESAVRKKIKQLADGSCISSVLNIIMMYPEANIN
ncbi:MAG: homoserine dehydrogenase, partial [Eubacteriales bacterium]|nr:homoserine dehydrogenase [Eubacteriales bacterium]